LKNGNKTEKSVNSENRPIFQIRFIGDRQIENVPAGIFSKRVLAGNSSPAHIAQTPLFLFKLTKQNVQSSVTELAGKTDFKLTQKRWDYSGISFTNFIADYV
jgi:hypothetical protein